MGNIKEYTNSVGGLRASETGIDAVLSVARRAGSFFNSAAEAVMSTGNQAGRMAESSIKAAGNVIVDHAEQQERSLGAKAYVGMFAKMTDEWNQSAAKADPNDPLLAKSFLEKQEKTLEDFQQSFLTEGGQKWAQGRIEHLRTHMLEKTSADMATLAGQAVVSNLRGSTNLLNNTVFKDPSTVKVAIETLKDTYSTTIENSPNLKGVKGQSVMTEHLDKATEVLVNTAVMGAISKARDPEAALRQFTSDPTLSKYIKPQENLQWAHAVTAQNRLQKAEDRAVVTEQARKDRDAFNQVANEIELNTTKEGPDGVVQPFSPADLRAQLNKAILMPGASQEPGRVAALVTRAERLGRVLDEDSKVNLERRSRGTMADLYRRMIAPEGDATRLTDEKAIQQAYVDDKLTWEHSQQLLKNFREDRSTIGSTIAQVRTEFLKDHENAIDPARSISGLKSPAGSQAVFRYSQFLRDREAAYRKEGKDPQQLYNPNSPDFVGAQSVLDRFKVPFDQIPASIQGMFGKTPEPAARMVDGFAVPKALGGVASLARNKNNGNWRDQATGKIYNAAGEEIK